MSQQHRLTGIDHESYEIKDLPNKDTVTGMPTMSTMNNSKYNIKASEVPYASKTEYRVSSCSIQLGKKPYYPIMLSLSALHMAETTRQKTLLPYYAVLITLLCCPYRHCTWPNSLESQKQKPKLTSFLAAANRQKPGMRVRNTVIVPWTLPNNRGARSSSTPTIHMGYQSQNMKRLLYVSICTVGIRELFATENGTPPPL